MVKQHFTINTLLLVIREGRLVGELPPEEATEERLELLMGETQDFSAAQEKLGVA